MLCCIVFGRVSRALADHIKSTYDHLFEIIGLVDGNLAGRNLNDTIMRLGKLADQMGIHVAKILVSNLTVQNQASRSEWRALYSHSY